jgi:hypothetical protein
MGWLVFVEDDEVDWVADSLSLVVWILRPLHALRALSDSVRIEM